MATILLQQDVERLPLSLAESITANTKKQQNQHNLDTEEIQKSLIPSDFLTTQCEKLLAHKETLHADLSKVSKEISKLKRAKKFLKRLVALDDLAKNMPSNVKNRLDSLKFRALSKADREFILIDGASYGKLTRELISKKLDELHNLDLNLCAFKPEYSDKEFNLNSVSFARLEYIVNEASNELSEAVKKASEESDQIKREKMYDYLGRNYDKYNFYLAPDHYAASDGSSGIEKNPGFYLYQQDDEVYAKVFVTVRHEHYQENTINLSKLAPTELLKEISWPEFTYSSSECVKDNKVPDKLREIIISNCMSPEKKIIYPSSNRETGLPVNSNDGVVPISVKIKKLEDKKKNLESVISDYDNNMKYLVYDLEKFCKNITEKYIKSTREFQSNLIVLSDLSFVQFICDVLADNADNCIFSANENNKLHYLLTGIFDMLRNNSISGNDVTYGEALYIDLYSSTSDYFEVFNKTKNLVNNSESEFNIFRKNIDIFKQLSVAQQAIIRLQSKALSIQSRKLPFDFPEQRDMDEFQSERYAESSTTFRDIYLTTANEIHKATRKLLNEYIYNDLSNLFDDKELDKIFTHHYHKGRAKLYNKLRVDDLDGYEVTIGTDPDKLTLDNNSNIIFIYPMTGDSDCKIYGYQFCAEIKDEFGEESTELYTGYVQDPVLLSAVREHIEAEHGDSEKRRLSYVPNWLDNFKQQVVSDYTFNDKTSDGNLPKTSFWQIFRQNEHHEAEICGYILAVVESQGSFEGKVSAIEKIIANEIPAWWKFWRSGEASRYKALLVNTTIFLAVAELEQYPDKRDNVIEFLENIKDKVYEHEKQRYTKYLIELKTYCNDDEDTFIDNSSPEASCEDAEFIEVPSLLETVI